MNSIEEGLSKYLPENTVHLVCSFIPKKNLKIKIVNDRITKLGDFRPASKICAIHRISINGGLNPYSFLLTLLHEIAHLNAFVNYGKNIKSHGCEWQLEYTALIFPFLAQHLFPEDLHQVLFKHFPFPSAMSNSDQNLVQVLRNYDKNKHELLLQDISDNEQFIFQGHIYKRMNKLRSFYRCIRISDNKLFRIHSLASIRHFQMDDSFDK